MASTMLTGERRWASTRKSSMTVLGKVPKPINLPSQRLENHGLDPNVEIVPKGTLTWGSRPSAVSTAWGSTLISPTTDGNSGLPSNVSSRPSSSGSGTRPSTAGSDKLHELASNAWDPNSRPSSASGPLTSNHTSAIANRPRSAETRPSSSQLSRFAEASESKVAWGLSRTAERVGVAASKANEFTLSSGDFPLLSSDKISDPQLQRGNSSHGRPVSSSGATTTQKEAPRPLSAGDSNIDAYPDCGNVNNWKTDVYPCVGTAPPNLNWQRDHQQAQPYSSGNIPAHQFIPWHNAPAHSPDGVWYRGGALNGPYRPAGPPGSYPIEPYAYYPQIPAGQPNSDPHSNTGAAPGGYNLKNAEAYHHHGPTDSYMVSKHPVIPVRPGLYPTSAPYEGYYGPPRGSFCNSSQSEGSVMGVSDPPAVCDKPLNQNVNLDSGTPDARIGGHASVITKEHKKSELAHESCPGSYKVLLKQLDSQGDKDDTQEKREQSVVASSPHFNKRIPAGVMIHEEHWRRNNRNDERTVALELSPGQEPLFHPVTHLVTGSESHSTYPVIATSTENSSKEADVRLLRKPEAATYLNQDLPQNPAMKKNTTLIEKIENLNNKVRTVDGHSGAGEKRKHVKVANKADCSTKLISNDALSSEYAPSSGLVTSASYPVGNRNLKSSKDDKVFPGPSESISCASGKLRSSEIDEKARSQAHKGGHIMLGRVDDYSKVRSNGQDGGDFITKSLVRDVLVVSTKNGGKDHAEHLLGSDDAEKVAEELPHIANTAEASETTSISEQLDHNAQVRAISEQLDHNAQVRAISEQLDHNAQRAILKEIAIRRAKELQREEEERTREQKAKALAKLEELNRRALAQGSKHKIIDAPEVNDVQHKEEDERTERQKRKALVISEESDRPKSGHSLGPDVSLDNNVVHKQVSGVGTSVKTDPITTKAPADISVQSNMSIVPADGGIETPFGSSAFSLAISSQPPNSAPKDSASPHDTCILLGQESRTADFGSRLTSSGLHDSSVSKRKQMGSRRLPNISKEDVLSEKLTAAENIGSSKNVGDTTVVTLSDSLPGNEDTLAYHRKRGNRNARSKNKLDETATSPVLPTTTPAKGNDEKGSTECGEVEHLRHVAEANVDPIQNYNPDPAHNSSETIINQMFIPSSNQVRSQATEKVHGKMDSHGKSQFFRKSTRNQQAIKPIDKFLGREAVVWAAVKPSNKCEPSEVNPNTSETSSDQTSVNNGHDVYNGLKAKRAEMERYVPKPVAKEPSPKDNSQQDNSQEPSPSLDQEASASNTGRLDSGSKNHGYERIDKPALEKHDTIIMEVDKPNRRGKTRASWRQRSSAESPTTLQSSNIGVVSDSTKPMLEPSDQAEPSKLVSLPEENFQHHECSSNDNSSLTEKIRFPVVIKDQGILSRQRRQQFNVQKDGVSSCTPVKELETGTNDRSDLQSLVLDLDESDRRNVSRKKNHIVGVERMRSQWQPKYHVDSHNLLHHNSGDIGQGTTSEGVRFSKELQSKDVECYTLENKKSVANTRENDAERQNACNQEAKRENKITGDQSKEHDLDNASSGSKHEQPVPSAPRRQGHQKNYFNRGQAAPYKGRNLGQDAGKKIHNMEGDKLKSNSHYEYQQIESCNEGGDSSRQNFVSGEALEGSRVPGLKYNVRGQNHPRRGGRFYAQRGAAVQVGVTYNSGG